MNLLDEKKVFLINLILVAICFLINLITYFFLPDSVALQIGANGLQNFVPKIVFMFALPVLLLIITFFQKFKGYTGSTDFIIMPINILLIIVNCAGIYLNLR
ncbi:MAG: DUF1648 domain-containing protein [Sarcina sp.]